MILSFVCAKIIYVIKSLKKEKKRKKEANFIFFGSHLFDLDAFPVIILPLFFSCLPPTKKHFFLIVFLGRDLRYLVPQKRQQKKKKGKKKVSLQKKILCLLEDNLVYNAAIEPKEKELCLDSCPHLCDNELF